MTSRAGVFLKDVFKKRFDKVLGWGRWQGGKGDVSGFPFFPQIGVFIKMKFDNAEEETRKKRN